jgi:hypothetical protein
MWCDYILIVKSDMLYQQMKLNTDEEMVITHDLKNEFNIYLINKGMIEFSGNAVFRGEVDRNEENQCLEEREFLKLIVMDRMKRVRRVYRVELQNRKITGITELEAIEN